MSQDFERLGAFYLGKTYDVAARTRRDDLLLVDAKDFTTHAVIIGMTGSGKTGLGLALLEEAAIDRIPVIAVDPKGDLANIALTFPELRADQLAPWIDPQQATTAGLSPDAFAAKQAALWAKGLGDWGQSGDRIAMLRQTADIAVYTPGSSAGRSISLLAGFAPPPAAVVDDAEAFAERIDTTVTGLLALLGEDIDPVAGREHVFLATVLQHAWREGRALDLAGLIGAIQAPPFAQVGVMPVDTVFPPKDRTAFALRLNNLLASPGFQAWLQGEPLDTTSLLYAQDGRPRVSVLSIAHLSDAERMFFVTLLLADIVSWMRTQPGTGSLRALLYIDELFGYMPPVANPPSKRLLLTLLKQARAFGLGVVLATQNPVDLDYKGLSNSGLWFIGRLQTERDVERVIDGLAGASGTTPFDRSATERLIAGLGKRVFLRHSVHDPEPETFETRWVMSYLAGPMTREQLRKLPEARPTSAPSDAATVAAPATASGTTMSTTPAAAPAPPPGAPASRGAGDGHDATPPVLDPSITQLWLPARRPAHEISWRPALLAVADIGYRDAKRGVSTQQRRTWLLPLDEDALTVEWESAEPLTLDIERCARAHVGAVAYTPVPTIAATPRAIAAITKSFVPWAIHHATLTLDSAPALGLVAEPGESEGAFRARVDFAAREQRDAALAQVRAKYATKHQRAVERVATARQAIARETADVTHAKTDSLIRAGSTLLGAIFGRGKLTASKIGTVARSGSRISKQADDVERAKASLTAAEDALATLEAEMQDALDATASRYDEALEQRETLVIAPKRTDVQLALTAIAWVPYVPPDPAPQIAT